MSEAPTAFWAILEIMGHQRYAGLLSEQVLAGGGFLRIDVPAVEGAEAFTKLFGTGSVYAISPCDEETAREFAKSIGARSPRERLLRIGHSELEHEYFDDDDS